MNRHATKFLVAERAKLKPLPVRRTAEYEEMSAGPASTPSSPLKGVQYSALSQFIGHR